MATYEAEVAQEFENKISTLCFSEKEFCDAFAKHAHRTNQQTFTSITLAWIKKCAELEDWQVDGRNEQSVNICKKLVEVLDAEGIYTLPMI